MSKRTEIQKYSKIVNNQDKINYLIKSNRIIYGELMNTVIYYESNTLLPKTGILIQEDDSLVFYGSKSILEKEYLIKFDYENIILAKNTGFTINFVNAEFDKKKDKCKFSIAWEDYVTKNIKPDFIFRLSMKIKDKLIRKAINLLKNFDTSNEAYVYYHRILNEKIYDINFLIEFMNLIQIEAESESEGISDLYTKYIEKKKRFLINTYPEHQNTIEKHLRTDSETKQQVQRSEILANFKVDQEELFTENETEKVKVEKLLQIPGIQKMIDDKIEEKVENTKKQLLKDYHEKVDAYSSRLSIEKDIYREIIKDNISIIKYLDQAKIDTDKLIDNIMDFYFRYKILNEKLPDSFTIDQKRPDQGKNTLLNILETLSMDYLKIIDPYFFPSELELLNDIPSDIEIKIITYAVSQKSYADKLNLFKEKLDYLRRERMGDISVKLIKFQNRDQTPLHDRAIFSKDWGISLSNSLSQIGLNHDILVRRIFNTDQEVQDFDDFWYIVNEMKRGGKTLKVKVIDL
ncbi:MAG: hypothetical protein JXR69_08080 [Candidatus Delongbacteria bacterium]|nr:hypothetical protein [Candidatus Delongbacteria bacterium]